MKESSPKTIHLKNYEPPAFFIPHTHLTFELDENKTLVRSRLEIERNPEAKTDSNLILHGEKMTLLNLKIDGEEIQEPQFSLSENELTIHKVPEKFILEVENEINPGTNKAYEGLYFHKAMFCTQNEPEGFRRITYFLDRSDVMSVYTTKIIASKKKFPILLSNGNPIDNGELDDGRHFVEWNDPHRKPSYLFALVAGDLGVVTNSYMTSSGREVDLRIYCDKKNESKCEHAMASLKNAMRWDEEVYGLEYDLNIYMIVAVDAFNMGAMENKGLNIFNSRLVLASPNTATDNLFHSIEGVVGHEYFHNWTGNRVTCRDWFQLTLKEGLTVFRDQEFSADMHSRAVQRVHDVDRLREHQFPEDAGPMAHPIRPASFIEINNFYTSTVYEKGAEVIRMVHTLIGKENFRKGMDKYFELYDGQAVTCEEFINAMTIASGRDFGQFMNWYNQAGTPIVDVEGFYDQDKKTYTLNIKQSCKPSPGQPEKKNFHFPLKFGLLNSQGNDIPVDRSLLEIKNSVETYQFENISERPVLSINRSFSAPVTIKSNQSNHDLAFLLAYDSDPFNRREAGQSLIKRILLDNINLKQSGREWSLEDFYYEAYSKLLDDEKIDNSLKALAMQLPSSSVLFQEFDVLPLDEILEVRTKTCELLAENFQEKLLNIYQRLESDNEYQFNASEMGRRLLRNRCLLLLHFLDTKDIQELAFKQYKNSNNMTDRLTALQALSQMDCDYSREALEDFYNTWKDNVLVIQMWFSTNAQSRLPGTLEHLKKIMELEAFDIKLPNSVRSLMGAFINNYQHYHVSSGEGYKFIGEIIEKTDKLNPSIASGLASGFKYYGKLDPARRSKMKVVMENVLNVSSLSKNTYEVISKTLTN